MSIFRTRRASQPIPKSPAQMFWELRRSNDVKFLWAHQAWLLDQYHKHHFNTPNVALELPTGSGKTLVGLLVAEYRRRNNGERIVYLCPTRQLANQVKAHADGYGIGCSLLIGKQKDYNARDFTRYQRAEAIAITTYNGLFNLNPKIDDPEVVICDDAHAGEQYIASLWSVRIDRREHPLFFQGLVDLLGEAILDGMRHSILIHSEDPLDRSKVDLVPAPKYASHLQVLTELLDAQCEGTDLFYSWQMIRDHLEACSIFISPETILIRPFIPPTADHAPFAGATQRVYMSATLGEGGELERITGIRKIERLAIPPDWENQGTGRRLILFPDLLDGNDARDRAVADVLRTSQRTLALVTENRLVDQFIKSYCDGIPIFRAVDIEEDLSSFTSVTGPAALVMANRYDGIDLPGENCRQLMLLGMPAGINLQERFLLDRLGATVELRDRIRTRLTQGLGRCTRDPNDFALVLLVGKKLLKWCSTRGNVQGLQPELQAEIEFGFDQCDGRTLDEFKQIVAAFLDQTPDWVDANQEIIARRDALPPVPDAVTVALQSSVSHEIGYVYALWQRDYSRAYEMALAAIDALKGGDKLKPYRAFWHYVASVPAYWLWQASGDQLWYTKYTDQIGRALATTVSVQWLASLRDVATGLLAQHASSLVGVSAVSTLLEEWQAVGVRFEQRLNAAREDIISDSAERFENGLVVLGRMVGCRVKAWKDTGAPDGLWILENGHAIIFEAKSEENSNSPISLSTVRQALTHEQWVRNNMELPQSTKFHTVLITPRTTIQGDARTVAKDLRHFHVDEIRKVFTQAATILNKIRAQVRVLAEEELIEMIDREYRAIKFTHDDLLAVLTAKQVSKLPTAGETGN